MADIRIRVGSIQQFQTEDAETNYVAVVHFPKSISYYNTVDYFDKRIHVRNCCLPPISDINKVKPISTDDKLEDVIAKLLKELAQSLGTSYQFYKIIVIFDSVFDVDQLRFCGLRGKSKAQLMRMSFTLCRVIGDCISNQTGCTANNHRVLVAFDTIDIARHGGYQ